MGRGEVKRPTQSTCSFPSQYGIQQPATSRPQTYLALDGCVSRIFWDSLIKSTHISNPHVGSHAVARRLVVEHMSLKENLVDLVAGCDDVRSSQCGRCPVKKQVFVTSHVAVQRNQIR